MAESVPKPASSLISGVDEDWLDKVREDAIEPELPICDPHHHLWARPELPYLLEEFVADIQGHRIESSVYVECGAFYRDQGPEELAPVGEIEFAAGVGAISADRSHGERRVAAGIVGYADLSLGARVEPVLEALVAAGAGRFRGIRNGGAWDAGFSTVAARESKVSEGLYRNPAFREGFARLGRFGLTFDAWLYHPQLDDLVALARAFPDQPIVMNHVGGPISIGPYEGRREELFPIWRETIRSVAACPNVFAKLGALGSKRAGFGWHERAVPPSSVELADAWRPYVETCIEAFGPERCMFESNFPVDKASCSYGVLWNAFKRIAHGASTDVKAALFQRTAMRFYALD